MSFFSVLGAVIKTVWSILCDVVTTATVDFMAVLPGPFKVFPDSYLGFFLLLALIAVAIVIGIVAGKVAEKIKKDPKAEWYWPGFGVGMVATFVIFTIVAYIIM